MHTDSQGWRLVGALSVAQIISWGVLIYSFSPLLAPMEAELGWSRTLLNAGLAVGLLTSGALAYPVGLWIDRHDGRLVMSLGSLLLALLLFAWSQVQTPWIYVLIWIGLGVAAAMVLYEAAFAVLVRRFPGAFRRRMLVMTLIGGFSSTLFIPLIQGLIELHGWRVCLQALAGIALAVCVPIHLFTLRGGPPARRRGAPPPVAEIGAVRRALRHPAFWGLVLCFVAYYATFTALIFHMVPMLTDLGATPARAVAAIALIGPAQVAGRLALLIWEARIGTARIGLLTLLLFLGAALALLILPTQAGEAGRAAAPFVFALLFGAANGLMTILRGTAVPEFLGAASYGAVNGALALPIILARAGAPVLGALLWQVAGDYSLLIWGTVGAALVSMAGLWLAVLARRTAAITAPQP